MNLSAVSVSLAFGLLVMCGDSVRAETCGAPILQTSGINYDPKTVNAGSMSTAALSMELLADFMGNGIRAGNPTNI